MSPLVELVVPGPHKQLQMLGQPVCKSTIEPPAVGSASAGPPTDSSCFTSMFANLKLHVHHTEAATSCYEVMNFVLCTHELLAGS